MKISIEELKKVLPKKEDADFMDLLNDIYWKKGYNQAIQDCLEALSKVEWDADLLGKLTEYCVHDDRCVASQWRMGTPTKEDGFNGYKSLYGYWADEKWYGRGKYPPCSCGLDGIIDSISESNLTLKARE